MCKDKGTGSRKTSLSLFLRQSRPILALCCLPITGLLLLQLLRPSYYGRYFRSLAPGVAPPLALEPWALPLSYQLPFPTLSALVRSEDCGANVRIYKRQAKRVTTGVDDSLAKALFLGHWLSGHRRGMKSGHHRKEKPGAHSLFV